MDLATASIIEEANTDQEYKNLVESIRNIKDPKDIPHSSSIKEFSSVWENLSIQETECGNAVLLNNKALIIPRNKRKELLDQLHEYHGGAERSYNLAREHWYWPNMKIK